MSHQLFGDGIHNDTLALQELLDQRSAEVSLSMPEKFYLINKTLVIHSNQRLVLPRFCHIKLMDNSNCSMLANEPADTEDCNIEIEGGIWNLNNLGQMKNPFHFSHDEYPDYAGYIMHFRKVKNFRIANITLKDPVTYAVTLDTVSYFTAENIIFDFNYGNPWPVNMDGIHCNGNCHYGNIRNLKGSCYDDMVALNADEGSAGPITNIDIDGICSTDSHSAVRLLTVKFPLENIHIHNVFGTYYQYCIGISKYYDGDSTGYYDAIRIDNIYVSKAERLSIYQKDGSYVYPIIWAESGLHIKNIHISDVYRKEYTTAVETICVSPKVTIDYMTIENVSSENHVGAMMPLLVNNGRIKALTARGLHTDGDSVIVNNGDIQLHHES